jgi:polysaccharide export outer membrane protein
MSEPVSIQVTNTIKSLCSCVALLLAIGVTLASKAAAAPESLLIGAGDQLHVQVADTPEMEQHPRVTDAGEIPLVGVGNVNVAGLTPAQAAIVIQNRLIAANYMRHPEVFVTVEQFATQSVSVLGEVKAPGAYPVGTPRSILDVLALAGGLSGVADRNILVERHGDPSNLVHYNFSNDSGAAVAAQVLVNPGDTVIVPKAGIVYVVGDVNHPGAFVMSNNESKITMLESLALAGGLTKTAKQGSARLIRKEPGGSFSDQKFSVGDLQEGKIADAAMQPGDVLYIPFSFGRNIAVLGAGSIAASAASAAIYAVP